MRKPLDPTRRGLLKAGGLALAGAAFADSAEAGWTPKEWTADAKLRNTAHTPAAPLTPEGRRKTLMGYLKPGVIRIKILETMAQGPMVVDTRVDRLTSANGVRDMYYMGVYFLKDGKIKEWSDYQVAPDRLVKPGEPL